MVATRGGARTGADGDNAATSESKASLRQKPLHARAASKSESSKTAAAKTESNSLRTTRAHPTAATSSIGRRSARSASTKLTEQGPDPQRDEQPPQKSTARDGQGGSVRTRRTVADSRAKGGNENIVEHDSQTSTAGRGKRIAIENSQDASQTSTAKDQTQRMGSIRLRNKDVVKTQSDDLGKTGSASGQGATAESTSGHKAHSRSSQTQDLPRPTSSGSTTRSTRTKQAQSQGQPLSPKKITQVAKTKSNSSGKETAAKAKTGTRGTAASNRRSARNNVSDENDPMIENESEVQTRQTTKNTASRGRARTTKRTVQLRISTPDNESSMISQITTPPDSPAPVFEQPKNMTEDEADAREALETSDRDDDFEDDFEDELNAEDAKRSYLESEDELAGPKTPMRRSSRNKPRTRAANKRKTSSQPSTIGNLSVASPEMSAEQAAAQLQSGLEHALEVEPDLEQMAGVSSSENQTQDIDVDNLDQDYSIDVDEEMFPSFDAEPNTDAAALALDAALQADIADKHMQEDPDETIMIGDDQPEASSLLSDNSVVRHPQEQSSESQADSGFEKHASHEQDAVIGMREDEEDNDDYTRLSINPKTPRPETINWYNVEPNTVLRETLDLGLSPNVEHSQLGIMPDEALSSPTKENLAAEVTQQLVDANADAADETVEFTEFVTMSGVNDHTPATQSVSETVPPTTDASVPEPKRGVEVPAAQAKLPSAQEPGPISNPLRALTIGERDGSPDHSTDELASGGTAMPHYMRPTFAFDARRRTLPARPLSTPVKHAARPNTSDGAGLWNNSHSHQDPSWTRPLSQATVRSDRATPALPGPRRAFAPFSITSPQVKRDFVGEARSNMPTTPTTSLSRIRGSLLRSQVPNTVAGHSRFRSELGTPATKQHTSNVRNALQRMAISHDRRLNARSPARTPLKSITGTPGVASMTLHPAMPLRGVVAIVEVYTCEGASASGPFVALLHRLGAKTTKIWSDRVTHVIFKDGSPTTLQRVALHNKRVARGGNGSTVHCVNSRWVSDCDSQSTRVAESDEAYAVSTDGIGVTGSARRKRKSMEPSTMVNIDGQLIRDRTSSWGRSSSGATPSRTGSPAPYPESMVQTPMDGMVGKIGARDTASPATPTWIAAPTRLVQATAPVKRIRRLQPVGGLKLSSRRLTNWGDV